MKQLDHFQNISNTIHIANAGDARAVISSNGAITRLSYDHKVKKLSFSFSFINAVLTLNVLQIEKANDEAEVKRCEAAGGAFLWGR